MQTELEQFDAEWKTGDRAAARDMAKAYVAANRDAIMPTLRGAIRTLREARLDDDPDIPDLVRLVDNYRAAGDEESRILVDMLLLANYQPQQITGSVNLGRLMGRG